MLLSPPNFFAKKQTFEISGLDSPVTLHYITPAHLLLLSQVKHPIIEGKEFDYLSSQLLVVVLGLTPEEISAHLFDGTLDTLQRDVLSTSSVYPPVVLGDGVLDLIKLPDCVVVKKKA